VPTDLRRPARTYTIGELCREFDCTPRALRFYEDKGLLAPAREGQHRIYSHKDRARLQLILRGKRVGLPLADIRDMLDLYRLDDGGARQAASSIPKFQEQIAALERQRADIEAAIAQLKEGISLLEKRLSETRPESPPQAVTSPKEAPQ
jgi:DNA-binding transcriptional MerR regulator